MNSIWPKKLLSEICIINPSKSEIKNIRKTLDVSFIPMKNVDDEKGIINELEPKKLSEVYSGFTYFKNNDVLFAKITPCMENGKIAIAHNLKNEIGFGSTEFHVLRCGSEVLPEWIYYFLRSEKYRNEAAKNMTGTAGQQRVPKNYLETTEIPLPSISEQKNVISKIHQFKQKLDVIQHLKNKSEIELKELFDSITHQMFSKDIGNFENYELKDVVTFVKKGIEPLNFPNKKFHYVSLEDIESNTGELLNNNLIPGSEIKSTKLIFTKNLVLYGKLRPYLNKVFLSTSDGICTTEIVPMKVDDTKLLPSFLMWYLRSHSFVNYAMANVSGTRMPRLGTTPLEKAKIPIPDFPTQEKIIKKLDNTLDSLKQIKKINQKVIGDLNSLSESILIKSFEGSLT